jgi:tetratricopeptide (TPR) repeat protein
MSAIIKCGPRTGWQIAALLAAGFASDWDCLARARTASKESGQPQSTYSIGATNVDQAATEAADKAASSKTKQSEGVKLSTPGQATKDSPYRYLADKAAQLYIQGNYAEAEKLYSNALALATKAGVHNRQLAMLMTNLASDLREEQRYREAQSLFENAIVVERKMTPQDEGLMMYTAKQYAGLLRETSLDASADAVIASAKNRFALAPRLAIASDERGAESFWSKDNLLDSAASAAYNKRQSDKRIMASASIASAYVQEAPPAQLSVTAQLRALADVERIYQAQAYGMSVTPTDYTYASAPYTMSVSGGGFIPIFGFPSVGPYNGGGFNGLSGIGATPLHGFSIHGHHSGGHHR